MSVDDQEYASHFRIKTVKILLKTWVRLFWTIQKIIQRDSNEENVFLFLDDIMKSGIHRNIESSLIVFQIDVRLTTLSNPKLSYERFNDFKTETSEFMGTTSWTKNFTCQVLFSN